MKFLVYLIVNIPENMPPSFILPHLLLFNFFITLILEKGLFEKQKNAALFWAECLHYCKR